MKAYEDYKESGTFWIDSYPNHWELCKLKFSSRTIAGGTPDTKKREYWEGNIPWLPSGVVQNCDVYEEDADTFITKLGLEKSAAKMIPSDSVLIALTGATCANIAHLHFQASANQSVIAMPGSKKIDNRYLFYSLLAYRNQILINKTGGAQSGINDANVKNTEILRPPLPEQRQIAAYLDYKTKQIDRFIANRKKQIDLLEERKAKTIERAILRGIDKGVTLKDSGFDWIGQIPNHWEIWKLKFLARITTGNKDTVDREDDGQYPFYVRSDNVERISTYSFDGEAILTAGDGVGVAKVFHYANGKFDFHQRVYCIYNFRKVIGKYAYYFIKTNFIKEVKKQSALTTVDSLRLPMLSNLQITLPPINEQKIIIKYIESELNDYEELISKYQKQIDLIQEYKTSLISKAVTGKIDVREWQPKQILKETV